jgi:hypothetical protein
VKALFAVLSFRTTVLPRLLRFLSWGGIGDVLCTTWVLYARNHWAWRNALVFCGLVTRVIIERAILALQTYECLNEIAGKLAD